MCVGNLHCLQSTISEQPITSCYDRFAASEGGVCDRCDDSPRVPAGCDRSLPGEASWVRPEDQVIFRGVPFQDICATYPCRGCGCAAYNYCELLKLVPTQLIQALQQPSQARCVIAE